MSKPLIIVQNNSIIKKVKEVTKATFLFPVEGFCVGYPTTYKIEDITEFGAYILVNRVLDEKSINELKIVISNLPKNIKGIVFEDIGVLDLVKDLDITKILYQNHLNASFLSVNSFLKHVDSIVVSTDITLDEIKLITSKATKKLVIPVFGYQQVMYSRRLLLTNFNMHYNETVSNPNEITEEILKSKFKIYENEYGTVIYNNLPFYGEELLKMDALYHLVNTVFLCDEDVISFINGEKLLFETTRCFLDKKTIYKIKGGD